MNKTICDMKCKMSTKKGFLLTALVLTVLVMLGAAAYGESEGKSDEQESSQINVLNPFTLEVTNIPTEVKAKSSSISTLLSETVYITPQIKIPYRPALRSAFRPPL